MAVKISLTSNSRRDFIQINIAEKSDKFQSDQIIQPRLMPYSLLRQDSYPSLGAIHCAGCLDGDLH